MKYLRKAMHSSDCFAVYNWDWMDWLVGYLKLFTYSTERSSIVYLCGLKSNEQLNTLLTADMYKMYKQ